MRFGCCAGPEKADFLERSGCDYYEPAVISHLIPEKDEEQFRPLKEQFLSAKIKPEAFNCFLPVDLKVVGENVDRERLLKYVEVAFRRANEVGGKIIVFGSGGSRMISERFLRDKAIVQIKEFLNLIAPVAKKNGITVCVEPLYKNATNFLNRVDEVEKIVREVNQPEIKVLADLFHMTLEEEPFFNLISTGKQLFHIHVPVPDLDWIEKYEVPFEHRRFFLALKEAGYDGRITLEDNGGRIRNWEHDIPHILKALKKIVSGLSS